MKMVVAYIEGASFEPIREDLLAQGFVSISAWEASGSVPEPTLTGSYRGAAIQNHLRPKVRLECVVGSEHVSEGVDVVLEHATERLFVFVLPVEQVFPTETVKADHEEVAGATG